MTIRPYLQCYSSSDVRETADRLGSPFFSKDTMRFHGSRLTTFHAVDSIDGTYTESAKNYDAEQAGYIITSDRTTFGADALRGFMPRRYEITRGETHDYTPTKTPSPSMPWCELCGEAPMDHRKGGRIFDRIDFESITNPANDTDEGDRLNGWYATRRQAELAVALDRTTRKAARA